MNVSLYVHIYSYLHVAYVLIFNILVFYISADFTDFLDIFFLDILFKSSMRSLSNRLVCLTKREIFMDSP